jgi:hypothetical protein
MVRPYTAVALAVLVAAVGRPAAGKSLNVAPNPSFELGASSPVGWNLAAGGRWTSVSAHSGRRAVEARTGRRARICASQPVAIDPGQSYRLDGWIRVQQGRARLGVDVLDSRGQVLETFATPSVRPGAAWQFAAAEGDLRPGAVTARLWFEAEGKASLDDVMLAPMKTNLVFNPTFDVDSRGRIGMWGEETAELLPGKRAGRQLSDAAGRTGPAMALEAGASEWWGARVVPANLPAGISYLRITGWCRGANGVAQIRVIWLDEWEKILRADLVPVAGQEGPWQRCEAELHAPTGAVQAAVSALAQGGRAWFDDFSLVPLAPASRKKPLAQVLVNQVGYDLEGPKSAVVATNFFPGETARGELEIVAESGGSALRVPLSAARIYDGDSADWGSYYWRGDFSSLRRAGRYRAVAHIGDVRGESFPFTIGEHALLRGTGNLAVDFFFVQRCGFEVPGWHKACHLDDARLPDGRQIDATGGWHSAGDYNKILYENGDGGVAFALVRAYDALPAYFRGFDRDRVGRVDAIDEALWGARFLAKMQNPQTGGLYKDIRQGPGRTWMKWSPPEVHTDNLPGTPDDPVIDPGEGNSPLAPAVWMRLGRMLEQQGAANDLQERARRYWRYLTEKDASPASPYLLVAALDLHRTTGESAYLEYARRTAQNLLPQQAQSGRLRGAWGSSGELAAGALASFALASPQDPLVERIRPALAEFRTFLESTADNPFGLSKQSVGEKEYFFEPTSTLGLNFNQLQKAWAAALIYRLNHDERALRIATDQVDWVLGKNPFNLCQCEGAGSLNPPRYHHRYDSIPGHERGAVPGCVPNGFVRDVSSEDRPGFDMSRPGPGKRHASYRTSEPWLVHNMWYLLALAELP